MPHLEKGCCSYPQVTSQKKKEEEQDKGTSMTMRATASVSWGGVTHMPLFLLLCLCVFDLTCLEWSGAVCSCTGIEAVGGLPSQRHRSTGAVVSLNETREHQHSPHPARCCTQHLALAKKAGRSGHLPLPGAGWPINRQGQSEKKR